MKLNSYYSLRKNFVVIGLTGRVGAGSSSIAQKLADPAYVKKCSYRKPVSFDNPEQKKFDICYNFLSHQKNFKEFQVIVYKNVLLLHLLFEASKAVNPREYIIDIVNQNGDEYQGYKNRFGKISDKEMNNELAVFLRNQLKSQLSVFKPIKTTDLNVWLKEEACQDFSDYYFSRFSSFSNKFYQLLNKHSITKRTRLVHDIAINLRETGRCNNSINKKISYNIEHIYTAAETINRIIKLWRKKKRTARIVIDSLKNSLELMYFKEKYSSFYMIAVNRPVDERVKYIKDVLDKGLSAESNSHSGEVLFLDDVEYKGSDFGKGDFTAPDIENCIQKSDFHIYYSNNSLLTDKPETQVKNIDYQLIRFLSLVFQPGIVTPTPMERSMQVAFNAKYNSGCISRQVGAVITDKNYSIKSIGWNDVAQNQMPCKLRSAEALMNGSDSAVFSPYEKEGGVFNVDKQKFSFKDLLIKDIRSAKLHNLNGRNCSFCFKSFQNAYEGEKNQVHTRSLHAEENAMMQIAKNGGLGLSEGYLFTTASPCELCSKKAFQLGIKKIFYIDPYPGIAMSHTLKNGVSANSNPEMEMFRGAIGRVFHKLYEPFMSEKDEIYILTGLKPTHLK